MAKRTKVVVPKTGNPAEDPAEAEEFIEEFTEENYSAVQAAASEAAPDILPNSSTAESEILEPVEGAAVAVIEAVFSPEFEVLEGLGKKGFEMAEAAASSLAGNFRKLADETAGYSQESLNIGYAFAGELRQAKSVVGALQIQIDFAKSAYVRLLDHFVKVSEIYCNLVRGASLPS